ncbi:NIPSNAP family protein [Gemmobacter sp.]|uniref:NIPSNAP family protein n=1 Tax=Gemmobacter sp. TaxID=1898957 RepID=UPI002AFF857E|nr:NIPSNAP family protein [Gemmobacter sp.]
MAEVLELATLRCAPLAQGDLSARLRDHLAGHPAGRFLGLWRTEFGTMGELVLLRAFDCAEAQQDERLRQLQGPDPFGAGDLLTGLRLDRYRAFPFLPPVVAPRHRGGIYEIRSYRLRPAGLAPTLAAWQAALDPARSYVRHLVTAMQALDGPPQITHIWGFHSLEHRARLRARHYAVGSWPPAGAPAQIAQAQSAILLAEPGSPLC